MQATKRKHESSVIERLIDEPHRFQFVQAVRILVRWLRQHGVPHEDVFRQVLRFENSLSLSFPASEIEALRTDAGTGMSGAELLLALLRHEPARIRITPAFIGVLGASGVLPIHHSEHFASMQPRDTEASARAFLDVFSNRMVALFYQAWGKYRVEHKLDTQGQDALLPMLMALAGAPPSPPGPEEPDSVTDDPAGYYAALLRTRPISSSTVARVLSDYFGVPIELEEFVGCWDPIPPGKRSILGSANPRLGFGAVLGVRLWRHDLRIRLRIGPLDEESLVRFLPNGKAARALEKMLGMFAVPCMQYEARLMLSPACLEPLVLTTNRCAMKRLGWNTFLTSARGTVSRPDVRYMLHPVSPALDTRQHDK